jgi:hypothetical protein
LKYSEHYKYTSFIEQQLEKIEKGKGQINSERGKKRIRLIQGDQKVSVHLMITVQEIHKSILNCFSHHDNVVRIRDSKWR